MDKKLVQSIQLKLKEFCRDGDYHACAPPDCEGDEDCANKACWHQESIELAKLVEKARRTR